MEQVAQAAGPARWFQLYWPRNRDLALSFVQRAEAAGYTAIVVTVDTWTLAWRPRDLQEGFLPFLTGAGLANYLTDPVFTALLTEPADAGPQAAAAAVQTWAGLFGNPDAELGRPHLADPADVASGAGQGHRPSGRCSRRRRCRGRRHRGLQPWRPAGGQRQGGAGRAGRRRRRRGGPHDGALRLGHPQGRPHRGRPCVGGRCRPGRPALGLRTGPGRPGRECGTSWVRCSPSSRSPWVWPDTPRRTTWTARPS